MRYNINDCSWLKFFQIFVFLWSFCFLSNARASEKLSVIDKYVYDLIKQTQKILNNKIDAPIERVKKCQVLMMKNLDIDWMARYTLGRHRKELSVDQINKFSEIYRRYVILIYSDLIKNYNGEETKVLSVDPINDKGLEYIVRTVVSRTGKQPIKVDYLVRDLGYPNNTDFRIADVVTEGISMITSQKSEFESTLSQIGLGGLISNIQSKLAD
jgi:phospholipid transport system substrate-binding protein